MAGPSGGRVLAEGPAHPASATLSLGVLLAGCRAGLYATVTRITRSQRS